ncbi:MAG: hypothetical protein WKF71_11910 [Pyrinomonadaceae bacterium]
MFRISAIFLFVLLCWVNAAAQTANSPLLIGRVAVNQTHIAFTYAGKIWLVERNGGAAKRLNDAGAENNPVFSPDGKQIAFSRLERRRFRYLRFARGAAARQSV